MTTKEQQTINELLNVVKTLQEENKTFKEETKSLVEKLNHKVEEKHLPVSLEDDLIKSAKTGIVIGIQNELKKHFTEYNGIGRSLISKVIESYTADISKVVKNTTMEVLNDLDFQKELKNAVKHKLGRTVVSEADSLVQKSFDKLKKDEVFKSKLLIAVDNLLNEKI